MLSNESIENYKSTLSNIGESLTKKGDILFYGCNIAANESGEALIKKISNFTKADIAASDDLTGKDGDWVLENRYGIVETKNVQVVDYNYDLAKITGVANQTKTVGADGIHSIYGKYIKAYTGTDRINDFVSNKEGGKPYSSQHSGENGYIYWRVTLEKSGITSGKIEDNDNNQSDQSGIHVIGGGDVTASTSNPIDSYMIFLDEESQDKKTARREIGVVTFDQPIKAVITSKETALSNHDGMNFFDSKCS